MCLPIADLFVINLDITSSSKVFITFDIAFLSIILLTLY